MCLQPGFLKKFLEPLPIGVSSLQLHGKAAVSPFLALILFVLPDLFLNLDNVHKSRQLIWRCRGLRSRQ